MPKKPTIPLALGFYGVLAAVAVVWDVVRGAPSGLLPSPDAIGSATSVVAGLAFAALVIVVSRAMDRWFIWSRRVTEMLAEIIGPLTSREIAVLAATSGLAEEMLFRGAMQPSLGLWVTSLIFGMAHGYFDRTLLPWTVMAAVVGLGLGSLTLWTGSLLAPVLAHFTVNYFEFHALNRIAKRERT